MTTTPALSIAARLSKPVVTIFSQDQMKSCTVERAAGSVTLRDLG
ncbi:MAG: hypothetical protein P0Y59_09855 [Candidatus Sphingomonas phytovorans]|nr:hypothetical protein [Sphingomonas sp.]WEK01960.1 MAG: hypothetical protein P0Y59_09855 [Sphingomonas sp.]